MTPTSRNNNDRRPARRPAIQGGTPPALQV